MQTLIEYIKENHNGKQVQFARHLTAARKEKFGDKHIPVRPQQITQWLNRGCVVDESTKMMYSNATDIS